MFYDIFSELCKSHGISCARAAKEIGLSNATPTKWKKTGAAPDGTTLAKVAQYFGVTVDRLLGNEKIPHEEYREALSERGVRILLDASAKLTDSDLQEIVEFIKFKQQRNDRK